MNFPNLSRLQQKPEAFSSLVRKTVLLAVIFIPLMISFRNFTMYTALRPEGQLLLDLNLGLMPLAYLCLGFTVLMILGAIYLDISLERLFLPSVLGFGVMYLFLFTPCTVPDEPTHFASAYYLSNFLCCPKLQLGIPKVVFRNEDLYALTNIFSIDLDVVTAQKITAGFQWFDTSTGYTLSTMDTAVSSAPLGYVVPAAAITLCRMLGLGIVPMFYAGRLANLCLYAFVAQAAMRRIPFGKALIFVISLLPMTLHEIASYSYDGFTLCLTFLFLAECLHWIKSDAPLNKIGFLRLWVLAFLVSLAKCVYFPLLLLIFLIPSAMIGKNRKDALLKKLFIIGSCAVLTFLVFLSAAMTDLSTDVLVKDQQPAYSFSWSLHHIIPTISVFIRTAKYGFETYIHSMLGFSLGWFEFKLNAAIISPFYLFLLLAMSVQEPDQRLHTTDSIRLAMVVAILGSIALIFASMFFSWTPFGSIVIEGIQGRYFLPLLFPFFLVIENQRLQFDRGSTKYVAAMIFAQELIVLVNCFHSGYLE